MSRHDRQIALTPVRLAIKGWAFTTKDRLFRYIEHAERERDKLPPELYAEADKLIQPLREELSS